MAFSSHSLKYTPCIVLAAPLCRTVVSAHCLPGEAVPLYFSSQDADSSSDVCFWGQQINGVNAPFFDPVVTTQIVQLGSLCYPEFFRPPRLPWDRWAGRSPSVRLVSLRG